MQRVALDWLRQKEGRGEIPTSICFLFYELSHTGRVSKRAKRLDGGDSKRKPDQNLIDAVTRLREAGLVPWDWIVDESRQVHSWRFAAAVRDYLAESVGLASIDRFPGVKRPVIVCESRGVAGVLSRGVAYDYLVTVAPTGGQCNGFLATQVAPLLLGEDTRVLYVGDFDEAGDDIEANTRHVLERHTERTFTADTWERVALTEAQTRMLKARGVRPVRKKDKRYRDGNPHLAYEAEAIGQGPIEELMRRRLEQLIPEPIEVFQEREIRERAKVLKLLNQGKRGN